MVKTSDQCDGNNLPKFFVDSRGCWIWTMAANGGGYPCRGQHRANLEAFDGPIAPLVVDHLCRVRRCVNPAHMEAVTFRENCLRGNGMSARHALKIRCPRCDSEYSRNNRGQRLCRPCTNRRANERYANAKSF